MKIIGILTRKDKLNDKDVLFITYDLYKSLFKKASIILIPTSNDDTLQSILPKIKLCNGIILPGGDDIIPLEEKIVKYLYKNNIPTLGICLGMQTMGKVVGGKVTRIGSLIHKSKLKYVHKIIINKDSLLYKIIKRKTIKVNSRHRDHVLNTKLRVGAISSDKIIEEVEDPSKSFFHWLTVASRKFV